MMFLLAVVLVIAALYFLPTVIAAVRNARHLGAVIVVNVLLGWTFIRWVVALAIAVGSSSRTSRPLVPVLATARLVVPTASTSSITAAAPDMVPGPAASVRPYNRLRRRDGGSHRDGSVSDLHPGL
jgi:hypothetical protein